MMTMLQEKLTARRAVFAIVTVIPVLCLLFAGPLMRQFGSLIMLDETPMPSDAVVVLTTGMEYYPRLIQAADFYRQGLVRKVIINGNRKTDSLRELEAMGFKPGCPWYEDYVRILALLGVPQTDVIAFSVEDAYDTVSEAAAVGRELIERHFTKLIITTSKYHTRRAKFIWKKMYPNRLTLTMVSAQTDPYDPDHWWKDGRQIRWVLAEYGGWVYYWWQTMLGKK